MLLKIEWNESIYLIDLPAFGNLKLKTNHIHKEEF